MDNLEPTYTYLVAHQVKKNFQTKYKSIVLEKRFTSAKFFFLETDSQSTGKRNELSWN
jgi:hypothetical protein